MTYENLTYNQIITAIANYAKKQMTITLTQTQYNILIHLKDGLTNKEIAVKIHLTQDTVEKSLKGLRKRFGCKNAVELMYYITKNEIIK